MGKDLKDLTIATLQKDKIETIALDIYMNVSQNVTLSISGPGELHLSGFFEPQREEMDENMFMDEEEEEEEEEVVVGGKLNASLKQAKVNAAKNAQGGVDQEEDSEDEEEYDEEDEEDDDEDSDGEVVAKPSAKAAVAAKVQ